MTSCNWNENNHGTQERNGVNSKTGKTQAFTDPYSGRKSFENDIATSETLKEKAGQGDAEAQYNLGLKLGFEPEAAAWFRKAAEQWHAEAQYNFGVFYANSFYVVRNASEAAKWFRKAAEQGHVMAQSELVDVLK